MTRPVALALTVLTGTSGLVYEVAWQKFLATLLGSHSEATAAVLAIFLGGLAVGYALFGAVTARAVEKARARGESVALLRLYGLVEGGIGLWALVFPWLFSAAEALAFRWPAGNPALAFAFDLLLTVLLIGPPTVLMGGTIPVLTQALSQRLEEATRIHAYVYAFNTAGAFLGALAGGFVLVPLLGLDGVVRAMGVVNLVVGALFLVLHRFAPRPALLQSPPPAAASALAWSFGAVALLSGFAMMSVQMVLNRIAGVSFGASHYTFAMVVAVFVLCIALGSFAVSALRRVPPVLVVGSQWLLVALLALLYFGLGDATYWAYALRSLFRNEDAAFYPYWISAFACMLVVLALPIGLAGALLPLLFHHLRREMGDLGSVAGRLYSLNTLGSLLGALVGGYALLIWLDLHHVFRVALAATALGAGLLTRLVLGDRLLGATLAAFALVGIAMLPPWRPDRLAAGLFRARDVVPATFLGPDLMYKAQSSQYRMRFYDDDPAVSAAVKEATMFSGSLAIVTNGKADGNVPGDYPTMAMAALLPALFAESPRRGFVIGFGTGVTVGELAALEETESVEVAEISKGVLDAAPLFESGNQSPLSSPKVRVIRGDAYRALRRSDGRFDVIVSEPSNPWVTGVEMLFSREFLVAAREHLSPDGVYAQWFHQYELDERTIELVLRTYASVFEHVSVWFTMGPDLVILGFQTPKQALDLERLAARFGRADFQAGFRRCQVDSLTQLLAHEVIPFDAVGAAGLEGRIHTLRHPILSHWAARAFFRGESSELPRLAHLRSASVGFQNSLLRRHVVPNGGPISDDVFVELIEESCARGRAIECATTFARWEQDQRDSVLRKEKLDWARKLPGMGEHLSGERYAMLRALYDPKELPPSRRDPVLMAKQIASFFDDYYYHALPFTRATLAAAFRRCESEPRLQSPCVEGRLLAEKVLGRLDAATLAPPPT